MTRKDVPHDLPYVREIPRDGWIHLIMDRYGGRLMSYPAQAVEKPLELQAIWDAMMSTSPLFLTIPWWRHQMETFSALLAICAGNSPVPGEFPTQRPVTRSFDVYFDLRPDKRLNKQSWGWWLETLSHSLWRHGNANVQSDISDIFQAINLMLIEMLHPLILFLKTL